MKPTSLEGAVRTTLRTEGLPARGDTIVMGLSGGADSVALLDVMARAAPIHGFQVLAAHLDHGLRAESGDDAAFCASLCASLGVPFRTARADVRGRAERDGQGIEDAARTERRAFLRDVARAEGATAIVLAHTRDDQAETLLLRLLRGAGSLGLSAMRVRSGDLLRPMLGCSRADVLDHLAQRGLAWREDASNADLDLTRNRIRHELLPYLAERFNPQIRAALAQTADILAAEDEVITAAASVLLSGASRTEGDVVSLDRGALSGAPRAVARAAIRSAVEHAGGRRSVSLKHVDSVLVLASRGRSGQRRPLPGRREAVVRQGRISIGAAVAAGRLGRRLEWVDGRAAADAVGTSR